MTSTAPLVDGWRRSGGRRAPWAAVSPPVGGSEPVAGPDDPIGLMVEIFVNSAWTDITPFVRYASLIKITRGRGDETSQTPPQTAAMTIDNRDGRFTPRNPTGPYYGQIGRNTPIRVSRLFNGIRLYRFHGEVPTWPTEWDISGKNVFAQITAAGMLRRLQQGTLPLHSALYRAYALGTQFPNEILKPVAYWPCEDGPTATSLASPLPGVTPLTLSGQAPPKLATFTGFLASAPLPLLSASIWTGIAPPHPAAAVNLVRLVLAVPASGAFDTAVLLRYFTTGTVARVDVQYGSANGGSLRMTGYDAFGTLLFDGGYVAFSLNGALVRLSSELRTSGSDIKWVLAKVVVGQIGAYGFITTLTSATVGNVTQIVVNPDGHIDDTAVGHLSYQSTFTDPSDIATQLRAWIGEPAADADSLSVGRFARLCGEQNINAVVNQGTGVYGADNVTMGYQLIDTFPNLLQQPVDTSLGLLYEARDQLALALRTRLSLYNQAPRLTLDYAAHQLSAAPKPLDDDSLTRNDITTTRIGGSTATQYLAVGTLSYLPPPAGVGDYPDGPNISLGTDAQLPDQTGWRLHMGTVDQPRYPAISINLRHGTFTSSVDLTNAALGVDIGDRIVINDPPAGRMPPDPASVIVQGYTETLGRWEHDIVFNTSPEDPYRVMILGDPVLSRADTDGSTLAGAYPLGTETTLLVAKTAAQPASPLWTTAAGDFPFDIAVGGERMTVTNITGASSPQTFTVTRSVNGVVKGQTFGTDVRLWQPMILSL